LSTLAQIIFSKPLLLPSGWSCHFPCGIPPVLSYFLSDSYLLLLDGVICLLVENVRLSHLGEHVFSPTQESTSIVPSRRVVLRPEHLIASSGIAPLVSRRGRAQLLSHVWRGPLFHQPQESTSLLRPGRSLVALPLQRILLLPHRRSPLSLLRRNILFVILGDRLPSPFRESTSCLPLRSEPLFSSQVEHHFSPPRKSTTFLPPRRAPLFSPRRRAPLFCPL